MGAGGAAAGGRSVEVETVNPGQLVTEAGDMRELAALMRTTWATEDIDAAPSADIESLLAQLAPLIDPDVALLGVLDIAKDPPFLPYIWGLAAATAADQLEHSAYIIRARTSRGPGLEALSAERDPELISACRVRLTHAATAAIRGPNRSTRAQLIAGFAQAPDDPTASIWALESCAAVLSVCLHFPRMLERFLAAPRVDALTGCTTYEHTLSELGREVNRSARAATPLSGLLHRPRRLQARQRRVRSSAGKRGARAGRAGPPRRWSAQLRHGRPLRRR